MIDRDTLDKERAQREAAGLALAASAPAMASEEWATFSNAGGSVQGLVLTPPAAHSSAAHLFVHGGGWVSGSPRTALGIARRIAHQAKRPVISVKYSLAPEHPYPQAIHDVCLVIDVLARQGKLAGCVGASAGAQTLLGAMMMRRDSSASLPRAAALFYGAFAMTTESETHRAYGAPASGLSTVDMRDFIEAYGVVRASDRRYGDLTVADLGGLPPLWLSCGDLDPLLADTLAVFRRSLAAGTPTRLQVLPGQNHGFINGWHADPFVDASIGQAVAWLENVSQDC